MYFRSINSKFLKVASLAAFFCLVFALQAYAALPEHMAVLPIEGKGKPEDLKELRVTFFNHIGSKNYRDMELEDVDSKLFLLEQQSGKKWRDFSHKEIADHLGVQGLIYLNVTGIEKIYAGVYGSLTVKLSVTFVEAGTGRIIWKKEDEVVRQSGGIPLSPWAAISTAINSALVLRDSVKIELFDKLCRGIAKALPEPPSLAVVRAPTIFSVFTNTLDSPFKAQDEILVSLKGDEGMKAYFNIVGETDAIPLNELKPGHYMGKYVVTEGRNFKGKLMEVFLVNSEKRKVSKYQVPYLVTVDTIPPGEPLNFDTGVSEKGFKLRWDKPADEDIKEYVIKKAVVGQAEYKELAVTELNEYLDENVKFGQKVFYRVFTRDLADNLSKAAEVSRVVVKPGPTNVTGELKEDTVFYSYGSPYIVRGELTVPKGIKLTVEAGSVVRFEDEASLGVLGSVDAAGTEEKGITFKGKNYSMKLTDTGSGGGVFTNTFFRNGRILEISNSDASFENCRFESFDVGLKSTQGSTVNIKNSFFSYNKSALLSESGKLTVDSTEFANNSEALSVGGDVVADFGKVIFKANQMDVTSMSDITIAKAEIPDKESFEVIRSFRGPVLINRVEPFKKSMRELKNDSGNDLILKIGESLMEDNYEDTLKYIEVLEELFSERYRKIKAIKGFALFKSGRQKEGKELILASKEHYAPRLADVLGLSEQTGSAAKIRFVRVKIPVIGSGEGIAKIALSKSVKQSVKDHVESVTGKLPRKKSFTVKGKVLSVSDKYAVGAYPVSTMVKGARFEGLYLVFLNADYILADLQDLRIIGDKKRTLRVGVTSCGGGDDVRPVLAKELNTLLFPVVEVPSKGCGFTEYKEDIELNKLDIFVIVKEEASSSKSRVSQNLKMINADMGIAVYDARTGSQLYDISKGVVVYHMNESMGTKAAMKQAFASEGQSVLDELVAIERKKAPKAAPPATAQKGDTSKTRTPNTAKPKKDKPAPAKQAEKNMPEKDKGIILSVAGVEPVFANMPNAFIERPFMTLVIENQGKNSIRKSELILDVPGYFPAPVAADLESIPGSDRVRLQLFAEFTEGLKKISKTKRVDSVITLKYGGKKSEIRYPVVIFDSHTTRWNNGEKIGLYIDEEDPSVKAIAKGIKAEADRLTSDKSLKKLYMGMLLFDYFSGIGMAYTPDSKRPFTSIYGNNAKVDSAKYPSEFIKAKSGDADDILIAYGSVLNALGIDMAYTVADGNVVAMFDTSIPEELLSKLGFEKEKVVIYDENIWIPLSITDIKAGSAKAWESGVKTASALGDETKLVVLSKALKRYKPVRLFRQNVKVIQVSTFQSKYNELKNLFK